MVSIKLVKTTRRPDIPLGALIAGLVWLSFIITTVLLSRIYGRNLEFCLFKRITGIPCLTCGTTRGAVMILNGKLLKGWLYNPLVFTIFPVLFFHILFRIITGYKILYRYTKKGRLAATILLFAALALNWVYVIIFIG